MFKAFFYHFFLELTVSTSVHWHTSVEHDHHWTGKVISLYLNSLSAAAPCEPVAPPPCLSVPSAPSRRQGRFALCSAGSIPQLDVLDLCSGWSQPPHRGLQPPPEPLIHTDRAATTANQQQPSWSPQRYSGRVGLSYIVSKLQLTERAGKTATVLFKQLMAQVLKSMTQVFLQQTIIVLLHMLLAVS